jgi:hypothetical protein
MTRFQRFMKRFHSMKVKKVLPYASTTCFNERKGNVLKVFPRVHERFYSMKVLDAFALRMHDTF